MEPHRFSKTFVGLATLLLIVSACRRREEPDVNSPSYQIAQSESLTLPAAVALPANAPKGYTRIATFYAEGVQKYKAQGKAGSNPVVYEWVFAAPEAALYNAADQKVGTHGAGPHWTLSPADSVFGQQFSPSRTAPGADAESIDWLLLKPKGGAALTGTFAGVDYIQRIATRGGKAPQTAPSSAADTVEVRYRAVYRFSKIAL